MRKIIIEIRGGLVVGVYKQDLSPKPGVSILDWDNVETRVGENEEVEAKVVEEMLENIVDFDGTLIPGIDPVKFFMDGRI